MGFDQRSYEQACEIYGITCQKAQVSGFTADIMMLDGPAEKEGAARGEQQAEPIVVSLVLLKQKMTTPIYAEQCFLNVVSDIYPNITEA